MANAILIDLFDRPHFNGKLLARLGTLTRVTVRDNRLYIALAADPGCPAEWYRHLKCDLSDLPNHCLVTARLEGWVEDPDNPGRRMLRTQPLEPTTSYEGDCSRRAVVTLHIGETLRRLTQPPHTASLP